MGFFFNSNKKNDSKSNDNNNQQAQPSQSVNKPQTSQQSNTVQQQPVVAPTQAKQQNVSQSTDTSQANISQQQIKEVNKNVSTSSTINNQQPSNGAKATQMGESKKEPVADVANKNNDVNKSNGDSNENVKGDKDKQINNEKVDLKKENKNITADKMSDLDLMTHLTQRSNRVFFNAQTKAKELKNQYLDSEHLLFGLLSDSEIYNLLTGLKVSPQLVLAELNKLFKEGKFTGNPQPSPRVKRIVNSALVTARKLGFEFVSPEHLLMALYEEGEGLGARVLTKFGLKKEDLNKKITGKKQGVEEDARNKSATRSALAQFTIDLTARAAQGLLDPVVERSDIIERVIHVLSRRRKNNPALIGEAGVGKTAIVEGLAQQIVKGKVPEPLLNKKVLQLDLMSVLAGASHRGEFEQRMKNLINEIKEAGGEIILFIDEMHNIVGAGGNEGTLDASNFLKPSLARGEMQMIGATTTEEYRKYIEKDPALERRFQPILVPEPTIDQAIEMLRALKNKYEAFHRVKIPDEVIQQAVKLSKRYIGDRYLPDKAVDLIDEAASAVRLPLISLPEEIKSLGTQIKKLQQESQEAKQRRDRVKARILNSKIDDLNHELNEKKEEYETQRARTTTEVSVDVVKDIISKWTGIPVSKISESETEKLANLEKIMHKRLINQNKAVVAVAEAIRRGRAGLKSPRRPVGSFVFLGPTGVGKTELAKTLAEVLFGKEESMIRFDMTEYMEKHEVAKLLGAPPGYVGYEEGGKLTEAVRRKPYSVVLFDEIEKAHPDIFNILLQILDDGRLTDNKGHTISFKETVVICTSNIGTKIIQKRLSEAANLKEEMKDKEYENVKKEVMAELGKFFRPELINRFDGVVIFEPLKFKHIQEIVRLQLKGVAKLLEAQNMGLKYSDRAVEEIAQRGFDPVFGARPLRRTIQRLIENPISTLIIRGKVKEGDIISIDFKNGAFTFEVERVVELTEESPVMVQFKCNKCGNVFETEVIKNSTTICSKCASTDVTEQQNEEVEKQEDKDKNDKLSKNKDESVKVEDKQEAVSKKQSEQESIKSKNKNVVNEDKGEENKNTLQADDETNKKEDEKPTQPQTSGGYDFSAVN